MAATAQARRLTEAHRVAQARLGQQTVRLLASSWRLLDPADLDGTVEAWLRATGPLIRAQRTTSARLAADYYTRYRILEARTTSRFVPTLADALSAEQLIASLTATGPARVKSATGKGLSLAAASDLGLAGAAGAAQRLALDAGRTTITGTIADDPRALGWARAASANACAFCLMVASRGHVYTSEATAGFEPHDRCSCVPEPFYDDDAPLPAGSDEARQQWDEATAGLTGSDALNAFRRSLAGT